MNSLEHMQTTICLSPAHYLKQGLKSNKFYETGSIVALSPTCNLECPLFTDKLFRTSHCNAVLNFDKGYLSNFVDTWYGWTQGRSDLGLLLSDWLEHG